MALTARSPASRWSFEGTYRAGTYGFHVRSDAPWAEVALPRILGSFPAAVRDADTPLYTLARHGEPPWFVLDIDGAFIQQVASAGSMLDWLIADVTRRGIDGEGERVAVHAGAVSFAGRGVLFPGPPDAGKSTLTAGAVRAGADYLSDEVALVERDTAVVHPFPRPLILDPGSIVAIAGSRSIPEPELHEAYEAFRLHRHHLIPGDLTPGRIAIGAASPIHAVVMPRFAPGSGVRVERLSPAIMLYELARNVFHLDRLGPEGLRALEGVARSAAGYRLSFQDVAAAAREVRALTGNG